MGADAIRVGTRVAAACLVVLIVLAAAGTAGRSRFLGTFYYVPACGSIVSGRRRGDCRGVTTGLMPSIETVSPFGAGICSGRLGVPI